MRPQLALALLLAALPVRAQKPWEMRVDLSVTVPVELPAVPPTNPFAAPLQAPPTVTATPMLAKVDARMHVEAAVYIDRGGECRRVVLLGTPLPGLSSELTGALQETAYSPAHSHGAPAAAWLGVAFDLVGRIKQGRVMRVVGTAPDPAVPPAPEASEPPVADPRDAALPATPADQIDVLPNPRRFRASLPGRALRQGFRILAEVSAEGRCARVVFLSCPDGVRDWLLRSLAAWTFRPGTGEDGPVTTWVQLDGDLEIELSGMSTDRLHVTRTSAYPAAPSARAAAPPLGA